MSSTRTIAILYAYYISLFKALNIESKYLGENFKFCMFDPVMYYKIIFFVDAEKEKKQVFKVKSKFLLSIQKTPIFAHYIYNSRQSACKYIFCKTLAAVEHLRCLLQNMTGKKKAKILQSRDRMCPLTY